MKNFKFVSVLLFLPSLGLAQEQRFFSAVAEVTRPDSPCVWAASNAYSAAMNECYSMGYSDCEALKPAILEKGPGYCKVESFFTASTLGPTPQ